ncbi:MAG: VanZ family protein [Acidobacteriota bacterium]
MRKLSPFIPAILFYLLVFLLSSQDYGIDLPGRGLDKAAHLIEFAILGFFLSLGFFRAFSLPLRSKAVLVVATGFALAVLDELHQHFVPRRSSDLVDALVDTAGIIAGVLVYLWFVERKKRARKGSGLKEFS